MKRATKLTELPALTVDFLHHSGLLMDNLSSTSEYLVIIMARMKRCTVFLKENLVLQDEVLDLSSPSLKSWIYLPVSGKRLA